MTDVNTITLNGRVTKEITDREFGYTTQGTARLNFSIANNKSRKQGEQWVDETSFFDVTAWGKMAESLQKKLYKGVQVLILGRLTQDRWTDQQGQNRSKIYILAENVQVFGARQNPQNYPQNPQGYPQQNIPPQVQQVAQAFNGEAYQQNGEFSEDMPF